MDVFIPNLETLQAMAFIVDSDWSGNNFIQTADIDMSPTQDYEYGANMIGDYLINEWFTAFNAGGEGFLPFGDLTNPFNGHYDGQGFALTGMKINRPLDSYQSLFGYCDENAVVKNVRLEDVDVYGYNHVGSISAHMKGLLLNCSASGFVRGDYHNVGGLVTYVGDTGKLFNCFSSCSALNTGGDYVAGLVSNLSGTVINCHSTGNVEGRVGRSSGAFTGYIGSTGVVRNCSSSGDVIVGALGYGGGFTGRTAVGGVVEDCFSTGNLTRYTSSGSNIGGFTGSGECDIRRCYSTGEITGLNQIGGFVGGATVNGNIENCFCTGAVHSTRNASKCYVGGFVGLTYQGVTISKCISYSFVDCPYVLAGGFSGESSDTAPAYTSCYFDSTKANKSDSYFGSTPLNSEQIKDVGNLASIDFEVWKMLEYPVLRSVLAKNKIYSEGQNDIYLGENNCVYGCGNNNAYGPNNKAYL